MSDFWNTSQGESLVGSSTEYEQETGNIEPIPDNSNVLAYITSAAWKQDKDFLRWIEVEWTVEQPETYANRKIWQKLWVTDLDPRAKSPDKAEAKRDKAKKMLATIDANCGGKLAKAGVMPDDNALAIALQTRQMIIKVMVWDITGADGKSMTGNWIAGVFPKAKGVSVAEVAPKPAASKATGAAMTEDQIPF